MKNKASVFQGNMGTYNLFFNKKNDNVRIVSKNISYGKTLIEATMYFELKDGFWQNIKNSKEIIKLYNRRTNVTRNLRNKIVADMHLSLTMFLLKSGVVC